MAVGSRIILGHYLCEPMGLACQALQADSKRITPRWQCNSVNSSDFGAIERRICRSARRCRIFRRGDWSQRRFSKTPWCQKSEDSRGKPGPSRLSASGKTKNAAHAAVRRISQYISSDANDCYGDFGRIRRGTDLIIHDTNFVSVFGERQHGSHKILAIWCINPSGVRRIT